MQNPDTSPSGELASTDRKELSTELALGGQAVIEGVMMRSPHRVAVAVRRSDGEIAVQSYSYRSVTKRIKWLGWPVIRGAVGLVESLKIGLEALNWSAQQADPSVKVAEGKPKPMERILMALSMIVAFGLGLGLFMYVPYLVAKFAAGGDQSQFSFHLVAGAVRVTILLGYLWVISMWKQIGRVFQYHGSEHKAIFCLERGADLTVPRVQEQTRFHPRCGTSFLLIVALASILFFAVVDTIVVLLIGPYPTVLARFLVHLPLIPLLAGLSYELLKYSAKHTENWVVRALIQPGLWLQRITTREPDPSMCEVALKALKTAMVAESEAALQPVRVPVVETAKAV